MNESEEKLIRDLQAKRDVANLTQIMLDATKPVGICGSAAVALFNIGEITIDVLVEAVVNGKGYASYALVKIGKPCVEPLITALEKGGYLAAAPLGWIRDNRAVNPLLELLKSENEEARWVATWALGNIGDARAIEPIKAVANDASELVRKKAAEALEKMRPAVCGFCNQEIDQVAGAPVQVDLFKVTNDPGLATHSKYINETHLSQGGSQWITTKGTVYWQERSVLIPCCKSCAAKFARNTKMAPLAGFVFGLMVDVTLYLVDRTSFGTAFWFGAAIIPLVCAGFGFFMGYAGIADRARKLPAVKTLLDSGWSDKPNPFRTAGEPIAEIQKHI